MFVAVAVAASVGEAAASSVAVAVAVAVEEPEGVGVAVPTAVGVDVGVLVSSTLTMTLLSLLDVGSSLYWASVALSDESLNSDVPEAPSSACMSTIAATFGPGDTGPIPELLNRARPRSFPVVFASSSASCSVCGCPSAVGPPMSIEAVPQSLPFARLTTWTFVGSNSMSVWTPVTSTSAFSMKLMLKSLPGATICVDGSILILTFAASAPHDATAKLTIDATAATRAQTVTVIGCDSTAPAFDFIPSTDLP